MPVLRREVELPPPAHQRARLYLGFASLLLSFLIFLDAAICSHPAALETRSTARRTNARLTRFRCPAAAVRPRAVRAAPATDPQLDEFRRQAAEQLERPWAAADAVEAGPARTIIHQPAQPAR
ncbi:MAG TPA: hypothetical protein VIG06_13810 [Kofleriaceae bacterium]